MSAAFHDWRRLTDFETDIESATFRLLPLLYHNLHNHGFQDPLMPRLKGIYRNSWSKNQLLFFHAGKIVQFFNDHRIRTLLMKGIPYSLLYYRNHGVRPMSDIDLLIPKTQCLSAIELLRNSGWKLHEPQFLSFTLQYGRSVTFSDEENRELDLHWHPIFESHGDITETDFWDSSVPLEVSGVQTRTFCLTDHLFHTIVHGLRYNPEPPLRWIADAWYMIVKSETAINWDRLMYQTRRFSVNLQVKNGLGFLLENFQVPIPSGVLTELESISSSFADRLLYRHAISFGDKVPVTWPEKLRSVYAGYIRQSSKTGFWSIHFGFLRYMKNMTARKPWLRIFRYYLSQIIRSKRGCIVA
jgi:hypothetical protein